MEKNKLRTAIREKRLALGMFFSSGSAELIEWMGYAGIDFITIEMAHTAFGLETVRRLATAAKVYGITPLVRVPEINPSMIMRILDVGVQGVTVPGVRTKQEATRAVRAVRYPPEGERGAFTPPAVRVSGEKFSDYAKRANEETILGLVCEHKQCVENIEEILAVKGVDVINIGPGDLSLSMGLPGEYNHPQVMEAVEKVIDACLKRGVAVKFPGQYYTGASVFRKWYEKGVRMFELGGEEGFFYRALKRYIDETRIIFKPHS